MCQWSFFLNGAELSLNSVNSGNLMNHRSMNWAQFKDPVSHMCLAGAVFKPFSQVFLPTILVVTCSWLPFWIDIDIGNQVSVVVQLLMSCEYLLMFYAQAEISECIVHAVCVCGCVCVHVYLWAYYFMCTIDDLCSSRCLCEYFLFVCSMYLQVSLGVLMMLTLVTITAQVEAPLPQAPYLKVIMKIWVYFFMNSHNRIGFCSYFAVFY